MRNIIAFCVALLLTGSAFAQAIDTIGGFPTPSGAAGGVLSGTYPNPGFASSLVLTPVTFADGATWGALGVSDAASYATSSTTPPFDFNFTNTYSSTATGVRAFNFTSTMISGGASSGVLTGSQFVSNIGTSANNISAARNLNLTFAELSGYSGTITQAQALNIDGPAISGTNPVGTWSHLRLGTNTTNGSGITSGTVTNNAIFIAGGSVTAGSGGTVVNTGLLVTLTSGSAAGNTDRAIWVTGNGGAASTKYAIYSDSTAASTFAGNMQFSAGLTLTNLTTGTNADFLCLSAGGVVLLQTSACTISSRRFKYDFGPVREDALAEIMKMKPILFKYKDGDKNPDPNGATLQIGFYAEDMAKVDGRLALYEQDMTTVKSYRQDGVLALAVKAIQEQQSEINHLRQRIAQMERHR